MQMLLARSGQPFEGVARNSLEFRPAASQETGVAVPCFDAKISGREFQSKLEQC
jgi:hypothetical protein